MVAGLVATWNDTASSAHSNVYINSVERGAWGAPRNVQVNVPGRASSWLFTEHSGERNGSEAMTHASPSASARRDPLSDVFEWLDVFGRQRLIFSDQPDRYWNAFLNNAPTVEEAVRLGKFVVGWSAEPYALALTTTQVCATARNEAGDNDTFNMPGATNGEPEVTITPLGGNMTSLSLTLNGDTISWEGSIAAGTPLTISSISSTVLSAASGDTQLTGAFDPADLDMGAVTGTFGFLLSGSNAWSTSAIAGTLTSFAICFNWRRRDH